MYRSLICALFVFAAFVPAVEADSPISKVVQLLSQLQAKVIKEGETAQKSYEEFKEWCEDESKEKMFEIKTGEGAVEDQTATIQKANADITDHETNIAELASTIATAEADLAAVTKIRHTEAADWETVNRELSETIDTLDRAVGIIGREMKGSSFLQSGAASFQKVIDALSVVLEASSVNDKSKSKLSAFIQSSESADADAPAGAPDAANYENKSGGILETLQDMLSKAEDQQADARNTEQKAAHNFAMLKQSLSDQISSSTKEKAATTKAMAEVSDAKATAEGELSVSSSDLAEDKKHLASVHSDCMTRASEFETSTRDTAEELKALATAKKAIEDMTGGASERSYDFAQVSVSTSVQSMSTRDQVVRLLRKISAEEHDSRLAGLAARTVRMVTRASLMQTGSSHPFDKVKNMIQGMIEKLNKEAAAEAGAKAYCDKEMSETKAKKAALEGEIEDMSTKHDKMHANIGRLTEEVHTLQEELANLAASQKEMDSMRSNEKAEYNAAKADFEGGLEGVQMALKVLRDYYAQSEEALIQKSGTAAFVQKSSGEATGIIGMLEVAESDFTKNLADANAAEESAVAEYEKTTQENQVTKATKEQDAKYKGKEAKSLETAASELASDRSGSQGELDAVLEYYDKLKPQCIAKPEPYEERKKRRENEIDGLKNALEILGA